MRFFSDKIIIKAAIEDNVRGFHMPVKDVKDLHLMHGKSHDPDESSNDSWNRIMKEGPIRRQFMDKVPPEMRPLMSYEFPRTNEDEPSNNTSYYRHEAMENVFNRLKHMNPTHGEMGLLSNIIRGWNGSTTSTGGQYLQMIANELQGRERHADMRYNKGREDDEKKMHEGFLKSPMHGRLRDLVGELSRQSQEEFRAKYSDNGTILHRGIKNHNNYVDNIANHMDNGKAVSLNGITSYTPSFRVAKAFGQPYESATLNPKQYENLRTQLPLPNASEFKPGHPMFPGSDWGPENGYKFNGVSSDILSTKIKPSDVFLTHNVVGTPNLDDAIQKEQEHWIFPKPDKEHKLTRKMDWYGSGPFKGFVDRIPSFTGNTSVHHTHEPFDIDEDS